MKSTRVHSVSGFVDIFVAGIFHYKHYIYYFKNNASLKRIIYSYKYGFLERQKKINSVNLFATEYLTQLHLRIFRDKFFTFFIRLYILPWEILAQLYVKPVPVALVMLNGRCLSIIKRLKKQSTIIVGEAVNVHPADYKALMENESRKLGIVYNVPNWLHKRKLAEVANIDRLLVPSVAVANSYKSHGFPSDRIKIISYGSNNFQNRVSHTASLPIRATGIKILSLARLTVRKGQHHLLSAIKKHANTDVEVTLVGDADAAYISALRAIEQPFKYVPHILHDQVSEYMRRFDVVVLASLEDGFGMVVTEALAAGVPVAVSKYAGASESVNACGGGIVFDPLNHEELWNSIERCAGRRHPPLTVDLKTWEDYARELSVYLDDFQKVAPIRSYL